uniref:Putative poly(ADP-ribose) polymerase n=1 Tax=viral metagenome TaxID=1070528 RepID=A0A6M3XWM4_9ZZZZ
MSFFQLEFSPNSRANCRICKQKILQGERRLHANLGSGRYPYYYHIDCIIERCKLEFDKMFYYMYKIKKLIPAYHALLEILEDRDPFRLELKPAATDIIINAHMARVQDIAEESRDSEV